MSAAPFNGLTSQGSEQLTSEMLPESTPTRTGRHRPIGPVYRALLYRVPTHTIAFVVMLAMACAARFLWGAS